MARHEAVPLYDARARNRHSLTLTMTDRQRKRYFNKPGNLPRKVPVGRVLAHNHVMHTSGMGHGINGFRCWSWPKGKVPRNFGKCKCGWSGLPHYRHRKLCSDKCETVKHFCKRMGYTLPEAA